MDAELKSRHTAGEWEIGSHRTNDGGIQIMAPIEDGRKRVAVVDCQTTFKRGTGWQTECAERDANAQLIASAPALLEALASVEMETRDGGQWDRRELNEIARAAIAQTKEGAA